tara:strand:+ start:108 stop:719 length:612 start_codon:yes stop_codon:yes gene_type:complete
METFNLFPTLVMKFSSVITESERINIFNTLKERECFSHQTLPNGGVSSHLLSHQSNIFDQFGISNKIQEHLDVYSKTLSIPNLKIDNSWFNIQPAGSNLEQHSHPCSIASAALYINVDYNSTPLVFENPNTIAVFNNYHNSVSQYNCQAHSFIPENGQLIIFPSWLKHGSFGNKNNTDARMVISFNTNYYIDNQIQIPYNNRK